MTNDCQVVRYSELTVGRENMPLYFGPYANSHISWWIFTLLA